MVICISKIDELKELCDPKTKDAFNECNRYSRTVEIHFQGEEGTESALARVHFPHNPFVRLHC